MVFSGRPKFLYLFLVALQLLAPFLHAHPLQDAVISQVSGIHIHLNEVEALPHNSTIHAPLLMEYSICMPAGLHQPLDIVLALVLLSSGGWFALKRQQTAQVLRQLYPLLTTLRKRRHPTRAPPY